MLSVFNSNNVNRDDRAMPSKFSRKMIDRPKFYTQLNYRSSEESKDISDKMQNPYNCESFMKRTIRNICQQNERGNLERERRESQKTWTSIQGRHKRTSSIMAEPKKEGCTRAHQNSLRGF